MITNVGRIAFTMIATVTAVMAVGGAWGVGKTAVRSVVPPSARPTTTIAVRGGAARQARNDNRWGEEIHDSSRVVSCPSCGDNRCCDYAGIKSGSLSLLKNMRW